MTTLRYSEASTDAAHFHLVREQKDCGIVARFTVDGEPVSKARARFTRSGHSYTPEQTVTAEKNMAAAFRAAAPDHVIEPDRTYGVTALFFHGTRQRRDVDNMLKLILDGLNEVAWNDDVQVVEVSGRKCIETPDHARTEVLIYSVGSVQRLTVACKHCRKHFPVFPGSVRRYCGTDCVYAARRAKGRPACAECGAPVNERRSTYCSYECMGKARRKPTPRCARCGAGVSGHKVTLCRTCYLDGNPDPRLSKACEANDHSACDPAWCACICHEDLP